jgi:hypothetical protein
LYAENPGCESIEKGFPGKMIFVREEAVNHQYM